VYAPAASSAKQSELTASSSSSRRHLLLLKLRGARRDIFVLYGTVPILSVFPALIVHSELKSVHPGFPVAFIF